MKHLLTITLILITGFCFGQKINGYTKVQKMVFVSESNTNYSAAILGKNNVTESNFPADTLYPKRFFSSYIICPPKDGYDFNLLPAPIICPEIKNIICYNLVIRGDNGNASLTIDSTGKMVITDSLAAIKGLLFYMSLKENNK